MTGSSTGLYDLVVGKDVAVLQGCGLGGTSLINANVALDADPRVFEDEVGYNDPEKPRIVHGLKSQGYGGSCNPPASGKGKNKKERSMKNILSGEIYP